MAEGKFVASGSCGGCDAKETSHFCQNCKTSLCQTCRKSHERFIDGHVVVKTDSSSYTVSNAMRESFCKQHPRSRMSVLCKQCLEIFCELCGGHEDHDVFHLKQDGSGVALKRVCRNGVETFVTMIAGFQRVGLSSNLDVDDYDEAICDLMYWCATSTDALRDAFRAHWNEFEEEKALRDKTMWIYSGYSVFKNGKLMKNHNDYGDDLNYLTNGKTVGVKVANQRVEFFANGIGQGEVEDHIRGKLYVVVQIGGHADSIKINNKKVSKHKSNWMEFSKSHGAGVSLIDSHQAKYEKPAGGHILITKEPLPMDTLFEITIQVDWTPPHMKRTPFAIGITTIKPSDWDKNTDL